MKKLFKKTLSIVLSLALTVMCLTCAFSGVTASADATLPSQMLSLNAPSWSSNNYVIIARADGLTTGHTFRLSMYKSKALSVTCCYYANNSNWTQYSPSFSISNGISSCEFSVSATHLEIRFNVIYGTTFYISDLKLVDVTSGSDTNLLNDPTSSGTFTKWCSQMASAQGQYSDSNITTYASLVSFDADVMGVLVPPEKNTNYPEKQLKFTAPGWNTDANPYAVIFKRTDFIAGHTYRLAMFQRGLLGVKYNLYANGTVWTQYSMESVANGAYYIYQFVPTQSRVEIRFNVGGAGRISYVADLKLYDTADPTTNLINDIATSENTTGWSKDMLNANQTSDVALGATVTVEDFDKDSFGIIEEPAEPETPDTMFRIRNASTGGAAAFDFSGTIGHTYEVSMLQSGVDKVSVMSTNWSVYERRDTTVSTRGDYTVYTVTPTYARCQVYISAGAADSVAFVSDIKVKDITANSILMSVDENTAWKSAMIINNPQLYQGAAPSSILALMDYDAVALGDIESEKPAEEPVKAIQIKAPTYNGGDENPAAVMTRTSALTAGHTYRLEMYKQGILSVQYKEYTGGVWTAHPISGISDDDGFSVYYFVPTQSYAEIRLSIGGSGKLSYISGIKLYDLEDTEKTNLLNDPTESGNFNNWGTHMLASNQMGTVDAAIVHNSTAVKMTKVASSSLIYFDEKCFFDLGDYNGDGALDVRDLVSLKKFAANYEITLNDKAFVDDSSALANELIYSVKLLLGFTYADFEILVNAPAASMQYSGGAETETIALKKQIYKAEDDLTITGDTYYVSANGSVEGAGTVTNPISADAVNDLSLSSGDAVLFKRGDTFRLSEPINMVSGVTYGAYGEGKKPELYGSIKNYAKAQWYNKAGNIWQTDLTADDVGVMVFNGGDSVGVKQDMEARLTTSGDYMNDTVWNVLYLYCEGNPSQVYDSIELATTESALYGHAVSNVKVDNLSIKYTGAHAVDFHANYSVNQTSNVAVTNCEIGWGGGFWFPTNGGGHGEQYGNGIEFYGPAQHIDVNNCYIYQQFDSGLTFQENGYVDYYDIAFDSNIVEYCAYNIEFFNGGEEGVLNHLNEGYYRNIEITDNILRFAGYGYGSNRPHAHGVANITCWDATFNKSQASFTITGNIFDCSANNLIYWPNSSSTANITASGNKFYQQANPIDYTLLYHVDQSAPGYVANASLHIGTQQSVTGNTKSERESSFTTQMRTFETGTSNAFWLEAE